MNGTTEAVEKPYLSIRQVANRYNLKRLDTVREWIHRGLKVRGRVVFLEAERVGDRWRISEEALARFKAACDPRQPQGQAPTAADRALAKLRSEFNVG